MPIALLSVADTVKFWLNKNSLVTTAKTSLLADADTTDGTTTTLFEYGVTASSNDIVLYRIKGGGHTWPGGTQYQSLYFAGSTGSGGLPPPGIGVRSTLSTIDTKE
jgi:polyhydroxybutyrate depolymerase